MKFLVMLMVFTVTTSTFAAPKDPCTSNDDNRDPNAVVKDDGNTEVKTDPKQVQGGK